MHDFKIDRKITVLQPLVELIDPHVLDDNKSRRSIISALYETLVERDQIGHFVPALAKNWNVSDDARIWTFKLHEQVSVHDGGILTAGDVVSSLRRSMDPSLGGVLGTQGLYQSYLADMELRELGNYTVRMITKRPFADLLDILEGIPIVSINALSSGVEAAGSGPYRLLSREKGEVAMESFPDYWRGKPFARGIDWIAEQDEEKRIQALLDGRADIVSGLSVAGKRVIDKSSTASVVTSKSSVCVIFMFNLQSGTWKDRRVRQALNYALNKAELIASVKGGDATQLNGPLTTLHFGYDPFAPAYAYDPDLARSLLSEAGFGAGLQLVLDVPRVLPNEAPHLARTMAEQYGRVGIQAQIKEFSDREAYAQMVRNKLIHDACCFDSSPLSTYRVFREKFHSGVRGPWWQGYCNPAVDALNDQAQSTTDSARRQAIYRQAYSIVRDDAPWIFLYSPNLHWGVSQAAQRWRPGIDGLVRLAQFR